jgi:cephalosporin hydroxylase
LILLPPLLLILGFRLGLFDPLLKARMRQLAQQELEWKNTWYGVHCMQYPNDLMLYQELIQRLEPDVIIETGTPYGGNTLFLATVLEPVNPSGRVVTVDLEGDRWRETLAGLKLRQKDRLLERIHFIEGSSTAPEVLEQVKARIPPGSRVLVILDWLHTREHVLEELRLYGPLVSPDSYVVVNDTQLEGWYEAGVRAGPMSAVKEFLAENPQFTIDRAMNRFPISCAPDGFLKRLP